jgi:DNA-binding PadR family transcriptional regulator
MQEDLSEFLPLSPAILHILMALAGEERHGYGIMQEVSRQSGGSYKLGPGTLYDNLQKLLEQGIVEEAASSGRDNDPRRKYYKLNPFGAGLLTAEIGRLEGLFRKAKTQLRKAAVS